MCLKVDQRVEILGPSIIEGNSSDKKILSREKCRPFSTPFVVDVQSIDFEARVAGRLNLVMVSRFWNHWSRLAFLLLRFEMAVPG